MAGILNGAYDMHVHAGPDVIRRKMDDLELAESYQKAGMKGFVIKSHYFDTAGRACLVRKLYPNLQVAGTIAMNRSVGGLNPEAVRQAARYGIKLVFMPTMDADNMFTWQQRTADTTQTDAAKTQPPADDIKAQTGTGTAATTQKPVMPKGIRILEDGKLAPPVDEILDIIRDNDLVLCSGHIAPEETLALFERAREMGVRKMIATHVEWPPTKASIAQQKQYVSCGAYIEHCIINILGGSLTIEELVGQVREIGAAHMILSTDLGQYENPEPAAAFAQYAAKMLESGLREEELRAMIADNPAHLLK